MTHQSRIDGMNHKPHHPVEIQSQIPVPPDRLKIDRPRQMLAPQTPAQCPQNSRIMSNHPNDPIRVVLNPQMTPQSVVLTPQIPNRFAMIGMMKMNGTS